MRTMALDFVRQAIEQTLEEEHNKNTNLFGGKNQVNLMSFYEQLVEDYEVDRFTEIYRDLVDQQNRTGLIMNGTIVAPENPQIMNINSSLIVPLTFNCSFRVMLKDRDIAIETINHLFDILRGRHCDIACFESGKLLKVGTIANQVLGTPYVRFGDFIGVVNTSNLQTSVNAIFTSLTALGISHETWGIETTYYLIENTSGSLQKIVYIYDEENELYKWAIDESYEYNGLAFDKYKVSLSFDSIRIDEPKTLNANEYCTISFGGSATVVNKNVALGNDLTKLSIAKYKIPAKTDITLDGTKHWLEPLEMPSGLGISSELSQLASHNFIQNKHNDGINPSFNYSFVLDKDESLIYQWWKYARYGIQGTLANSYSDGITPNTLYKVNEIWSYWGEVEVFEYIAKATDNIDIENTESDALTIKLTFEVQKE